jgi:fatty acid CoA ligase FadD9
MKTAGYSIERVVDYEEWFRRFHDALTSLTEPARSRSPLAILDAWSRGPEARVTPPIDDALLLGRLRAVDPRLAELPHVSEAIIHRTLEDMAMLGVIGGPPPRPAHAA